MLTKRFNQKLVTFFSDKPHRYQDDRNTVYFRYKHK